MILKVFSLGSLHEISRKVSHLTALLMLSVRLIFTLFVVKSNDEESIGFPQTIMHLHSS